MLRLLGRVLTVCGRWCRLGLRRYVGFSKQIDLVEDVARREILILGPGLGVKLQVDPIDFALQLVELVVDFVGDF